MVSIFSSKPTILKPFTTRHAKKIVNNTLNNIKKKPIELSKDYSYSKNQKQLIKNKSNLLENELITIQNDADVLYEASSKAPKELKEIEMLFSKLKSKGYSKKLHKQLEVSISKFTGIKNVHLYFQYIEYNAYVIPLYKEDNASKQLFEAFEKNKKDNAKTNKKELQHLSSIFDKIIICFGKEIITYQTAGELVAILLHELGHAYMHYKHFPSYIARIAYILKSTGNVIAYSGFLSLGPIGKLASVALLVFTRTLRYSDHLEEYNADKFAVAYGYGEEMATSLYQFHYVKHVRPPKSFISKMIETIHNFLYPPFHPEEKKRICNVISKMKNEYIKHYPKLSKDIATLTHSLKC